MYVGSNEMPFTAWKHEERNRRKDRQKYLLKIHPTRLFGPTRLIGT